MNIKHWVILGGPTAANTLPQMKQIHPGLMSELPDASMVPNGSWFIWMPFFGLNLTVVCVETAMVAT